MGAITKEEKIRREALAQRGIKVCSHCKRELEFSCFCNDKTQRDGLSNTCRDCRSANNKKYEQDHKNERAEYKRNYRKRNRDSLSVYNKQYNQEHVEDISQRRKLYYKANRNQLIEATRIWKKNNPDKIQAYNESEKVKIMKKSYRHKRRALIANANGCYTGVDVEDLLMFFNNRCAYTGEQLVEHFHLDHVVPLVSGGTNYIWNIVPSNPVPNLSKGGKDMETWFREQEYFSEERLNQIYEWMNIKKQKEQEEIQYDRQYDIEEAV